VPCCQKNTPTDCFFGDFAHCETKVNVNAQIFIKFIKFQSVFKMIRLS